MMGNLVNFRPVSDCPGRQLGTGRQTPRLLNGLGTDYQTQRQGNWKFCINYRDCLRCGGMVMRCHLVRATAKRVVGDASKRHMERATAPQWMPRTPSCPAGVASQLPAKTLHNIERKVFPSSSTISVSRSKGGRRAGAAIFHRHRGPAWCNKPNMYVVSLLLTCSITTA